MINEIGFYIKFIKYYFYYLTYIYGGKK